MGIRVEGEAVVKVDGQEAGQQLNKLQTTVQELKRKLVELKQQPLIDPKAEKDLKKAITDTNKEIKALQQSTFSVKKVIDDLSGSSLKELNKAYKKLNIEAALLNRNTDEYGRKRNQMRLISAEMTRVRNEMKTTTSSTSGFFGKMADGFNKYAGLMVGFAASVTGLVFTIKSAIQIASQFEERVDNLAALTGLQGKELNWLADTAKKTSTSIVEGNIRIKQSATDIVDAYTKVGSQRPELLKNKEALHAVTQDAIILSEAAKDKLGPSTNALTNTLNQFNLAAKDSRRVINILAAGSKEGAASIPYLSQAIEKCGTTASLMGISVEQSVGIIETVAPKFSKAEEAGNSLDKVLLKMKDKNIGFKNGVFDINTALDQLKVRFAKGETAGKIFGVEHAKMVEVLVNSQPEINKYTKAVTNTNIALEQAAINTDNNAAKMAQAKNKFDLIAMSVGERLAPALTISVSGMSALVKLMAKLIVIPLDEKIHKEQIEFNSLIGALQATNTKSEIRKKLITELQSKYPDYIKNIDLEKASYSELQQVLHNANIEFNKKIRLAVIEDKLKENQEKAVDLERKRYELIKKIGNFENEYFGERARFLTEEQKKKEIEIALELKFQEAQKKRNINMFAGQASPFQTTNLYDKSDPLTDKLSEFSISSLQIKSLEKQLTELAKINQDLATDKFAIEPTVVNPETLTTDNNKTIITNPDTGSGSESNIKNLKSKKGDTLSKSDLESAKEVEAYDKLKEKAEEFNNDINQLSQEGIFAEFEQVQQKYDGLMLEAETYKEAFIGQENYYAEIEKQLEDNKERDLKAIRDKYRKEDEEATTLLLQKKFEDYASTFSGISELIGAFGAKNKAMVLAQLAADMAAAISHLMAMSEGNPLNLLTGGAAGIAQFAMGMARIVATVAKAKQLLGGDKKKQNYEGRYPVIGAQDGKQYNVPYRGNLQTGYLPKGAALFNERGTEAVITAEHLRNPVVAVNYQRILDAINNKPTKQHADGRLPQVPATQTIVQNDQETKVVLMALHSEIAKMNTEGVKSVWEYDRFKKGVDDHERVKSKTSL